MITSDRQLKVTNEKIEHLKASSKQKLNAKMNPVLQKAARIQTEALILEMQNQVEEYMALKSQGIRAIKFQTPQDFLLITIRYRIAKQLSQEAFSRLVGVSVRQVARYESEEYQNIQTDTLKKILDRIPIALNHAIVEDKKIG